MHQTHTIAPRTPAYSTAGAILAVLAIASLLDIATAQALSQTDRAPSFAVRLFEVLDIYTSPVAFITALTAAACWAGRAQRAFRFLFDATLVLSAIALLDNVVGLIMCLFDKQENPGFLLLSAALVYLENIAVFTAFYWRFDHPYQQRIVEGEGIHPGILFPQNTLDMESLRRWRPAFVDYLFLSFNTASTFGPTHPVPLRGVIQVGTMVQVAIAMAVLVMLAARAIGLIG